MFSRKNTINSRSLLTIFAVIVTAFWCGENTITTNAQTTPRRVPMDFTGDGRSDGTPATWYINNSATNATTAANFGISDPTFEGGQDMPVRGDYDGDGRFDIAVYRRSNQNFYYLRSSTNNTVVDGQKFGDPGDEPLASYAIGYIY